MPEPEWASELRWMEEHWTGSGEPTEIGDSIRAHVQQVEDEAGALRTLLWEALEAEHTHTCTWQGNDACPLCGRFHDAGALLAGYTPSSHDVQALIRAVQARQDVSCPSLNDGDGSIISVKDAP